MDIKAKIDVIVSVCDSHLDRLGEVRKNLSSQGMEINEVLEIIGSITGSVHSTDLLKTIADVPGVETVEESQTIQIAPPDAEVQ